MCSTCMSYPCMRGCPNYEPPKRSSFWTCKYCGQPILPGDFYADLAKGLYCKDCLDGEMTASEIMDACDVTFFVSQEDD